MNLKITYGCAAFTIECRKLFKLKLFVTLSSQVAGCRVGVPNELVQQKAGRKTIVIFIICNKLD